MSRYIIEVPDVDDDQMDDIMENSGPFNPEIIFMMIHIRFRIVQRCDAIRD